MSKLIKVGDLVQIIKPVPCCGNSSKIGFTFKVSLILVNYNVFCNWCGKERIGTLTNHDGHPSRGWSIERLKKIDPPAEGETERCGTLVLNKKEIKCTP